MSTPVIVLLNFVKHPHDFVILMNCTTAGFKGTVPAKRAAVALRAENPWHQNEYPRDPWAQLPPALFKHPTDE